MRFIGSHQLQHEKDLKDSKLAIRDDKTSSTVVSPNGTTVSFSDMLFNKGAYTIILTVTKDFGGKTGVATKRIQFKLV